LNEDDFMKSIALSAVAAALFLAASPAAAQVALEANVARSEGQWGGELGAGYSVISIGGFRITPAAGVFLSDGDDNRYFLDNAATPPECIKVKSGKTVSDKRCESDSARLYGRVEATFTLPVAGVSVGTGARLMSGTLRPYGTLAAPLAPLLNVKANAGPKYLAAGLQARF
jgi:hypothetical protein